MDAKFQPSFMPKQPIVSAPRVVGNISILYLAGSILFIVTLGLIAAVFIGERTIKQEITDLTIQLVDARNSFELGTIVDLKQISARTHIAKDILNRHVATTKFFEALGEETFTNIAFSNLAAQTTDAQEMTVSLQGTSGSYNTLILQKDLFAEVPFLTQAEFSSFTLDDEGRVGFSFKGSVDPKLIDYKRHLTTEE